MARWISNIPYALDLDGDIGFHGNTNFCIWGLSVNSIKCPVRRWTIFSLRRTSKGTSVSQNTPDNNEAAQERTKETKRFVRRVRAATRRKYTSEEKVRIVIEGFRREVTVDELCRREVIKPNNFYSWTKEFMKASKDRLCRDTTRGRHSPGDRRPQTRQRRPEADGITSLCRDQYALLKNPGAVARGILTLRVNTHRRRCNPPQAGHNIGCGSHR